MAGHTFTPSEPLAQPLSTTPQTAGKTRLLYVDNLRVGLITLVITGHMAITYGAPIGDWYYHEEGDVGAIYALVATLLLGVGAAFLLGLFFMIAGYFTPGPYDRKGPRRFVADRLIRLGIPLLFYALVINPLVTYWAAAHGGYEGSYFQYVPSHLPELQTASVGPLWFVEALLIFCLAYALARLLVARLVKTKAGDHRQLPVPRNGSILLFALGLGLTTFIVRIWAPFGWSWEPPHLELAHFPQYVSFFALGLLAYRNDWFSRFPTRRARIWGWVGLAGVPLLPVLAIAAGALADEMDPAITGGFTWLSLAYSLWEGLIGVALLIFVFVWAREHVNRQGKLLQRMSSAAYGAYVLHPLVIVPLAITLSGLSLVLALKFVIFAPLAVTLCFLVAYGAKHLPGLRRIL